MLIGFALCLEAKLIRHSIAYKGDRTLTGALGQRIFPRVFLRAAKQAWVPSSAATQLFRPPAGPYRGGSNTIAALIMTTTNENVNCSLAVSFIGRLLGLI